MLTNIIIFSILSCSISGFVIGNVLADKITGSGDEEFKMTFGEICSSVLGLLFFGGLVSVLCWLFDMFGICESMLPGPKSKNDDYDAVKPDE